MSLENASARKVIVLSVVLVVAQAATYISYIAPAMWAMKAGDAEAGVHPNFRTPLTGRSNARPAVQIEILDAGESFFASEAELYLSVQSSRFPSETRVLLPVNVGEFQGCRSRFVQLPFEVEPMDTVMFELLDEDSFSEDDEIAVLDACKGTGFLVRIGAALYEPSAFLAPVLQQATEYAATSVAKAAFIHWESNPFESFGTAEFIVPDVLPAYSHDANKLTIIDDSKRAKASLRIYGPTSSLAFATD